MPQLAERVREGAPIRIVALGSSSTEGTSEASKAWVYPAVLGARLSKELLTPVDVINKGKGGDTIPRMLERLERDVLDLRPDLVVWQLGVNDVLASNDVGPAIGGMVEGLRRLRERGVPVVLVDLQSAPMVDNDADTPRMQAAIDEAARREGVQRFRRYDVMRALVKERVATADELVMADGLHMTRLGHQCTGQLLAEQIAQASLIKRAR